MERTKRVIEQLIKILDKSDSAMNKPEVMAVTFLYKNHRGEEAIRKVIPILIEYSSNEWHPDKQWLLKAHDLDKNAIRSFAMSSIRNWQPLVTVSP